MATASRSNEPNGAGDDNRRFESARGIGREFVTAIDDACCEYGHWRDDDRCYSRVEAILSATLGQLADLGVWGPDNRIPSNVFWEIAGKCLSVGDLQLHARAKPRGYAGDFELLEKICQHRLCDDPLGRLFDRFFQNQHAPQAVRNRMRLIADRIEHGCRSSDTGHFHVVSIGSGPAADIRKAAAGLVAQDKKQMHATLLDLDPNALSVAEQRLSTLLPSGHVQTVQCNLKRLARRTTFVESILPADLVVCAGFFDYLPRNDAADLLKTMSRMLKPSGQAIAFNFAVHNPTRAYMEWIGNWYLTYRTSEQMHELAETAGLSDEQFVVHSEPLGINLYLDVTSAA